MSKKMKTLEKEVEINGQNFTIRELSIGEMMPILPRLEKHEEAQEAQIEMMQKCVLQDGQLLGDRVSELGISTYLKLAEALMEMLGMGKGEGKD